MQDSANLRTSAVSRWSTLLIFTPILGSLLVLFADQQQILNLFRYSLFYILAVVPISIFLCSLIIKNQALSIFQKLVLGYPMAIIGISLSFILCKHFDSTIFSFILPILAIAYISKRKSQIFAQSNKNNEGARFSMLMVAIYAIAACLLFLTFTLTARAPVDPFTSNVFEDTLWTVGNTWSALRGGLPLEDARFSGVGLSYHIAQNLYYASTSTLTSINPVDLHLKIAPYYDLFFLVAIIPVTSNLFLKKDGWRSVLITIPLLFSSIEITKLKVGADPNLFDIYWNPISMVFGLGSFIILIMILSQTGRQKHLPIIYISLLFTLSMSAKGLVGLLVLGAYALKLLVEFIRTRKLPNGHELTLLICLGITFIIIKSTLFAGAQGHTVSPRIEVSPVAIAISSKFGMQELVQKSYFLIGPISRFVRFIFHTLIWNWTTLPVLVFCIWSKQVRRSIKLNAGYYKFMILLTAFSGLLFAANIFESYWATLYLYRYVFASTSIGLGLMIYELSDFSKRPEHFQKIIASGYLLVLSIPTFLFFKGPIQAVGRDGWMEERGMAITSRPLRHINESEYKAMEWIRDNIADNKIIASDRKDKTGWSGTYTMQVWFGYSAYSGKQFYNEGADYNPHAVKRVAPKRWENIQNLLQSKNRKEVLGNFEKIEADYLIVTKRITKDIDQLRNHAEVIFENRGIILFKNPSK